MNMNNGSFVNDDTLTLEQNSDYQKAVQKQYPKPNFFNSKKIAEELLEERKELLSIAEKFKLFTAAGIMKSFDEGYAYQDELRAEINSAQQELQEIRGFVVQAKDLDRYESFGLYAFEHPAENSVKLSDELRRTRSDIGNFVINKQAASASSGFTFNNSAKEGKKFVNDMVKLMLRAYNAEAENAVKSVKSDKTEIAITRLEKAKIQVEKLGSMINLQINPKYHKARLREIELAFEYHAVVRVEKELEKERRAELSEQKKVEAAFKKEQENLEKELKQKQIALEQLKKRQESSNHDLTMEDLSKLADLADEIEDIEESISETTERAANLKAGYVYVISNIGSFGEGRVKIGMTRRIDPMDRVKELGDASVPFEFDVHLLHYSENAVDIETQLHRYFADRRVNMINKRKEHFYASPAEVKEAITKLGLDGSITTFTENVEAIDFIESVNIRKQLSSSSPASRGRRAAF